MTLARYDAAFVKREALRRKQRQLGVYAVPAPAVLDRIVAEHEAAARLGRALHDDLCERAYVGDFELGPCYCTERADALERIARRLDAADDPPLVSP